MSSDTQKYIYNISKVINALFRRKIFSQLDMVPARYDFNLVPGPPSTHMGDEAELTGCRRIDLEFFLAGRVC